MVLSISKRSLLKYFGYVVTVAVGFLLYVLLREYFFPSFNDTGSLENEIKIVADKLPITDEKQMVTISKLESDEEYNLVFSMIINPDWEHFPKGATTAELLKYLHATDGKIDSSVLCRQTLVRLAIGQGGMVFVKYSVPGLGIDQEKVRIECSPLER